MKINQKSTEKVKLTQKPAGKTMLDILLVNPPGDLSQWEVKLGSRLPPMGLASLASYIRKHGVSVKILDAFNVGLGIDAVLEIVGARHEPVEAALREQVGDPAPAPAATDQAEVDLGVRFGAECQGGAQDGQGGSGRRAGQEPAARDHRAFSVRVHRGIQ